MVMHTLVEVQFTAVITWTKGLLLPPTPPSRRRRSSSYPAGDARGGGDGGICGRGNEREREVACCLRGEDNLGRFYLR